jgi:hypothetical protein
MKRITLALTFLLATSSAASAQFAPSKENLRGLTGVRLVVMYGHCPSRSFSNCAEGLDEAQRPELLKTLEADATAKLETAGIPLFRNADQVTSGGFAHLVILVTLDKPNGFVRPIVTELKLFQRVRLLRDISIETDAVTWSREGVGRPLEVSRIRRLVADHLDRFIEDYQSVNSKQAARAAKGTSKHEKR